MGYTIVIGELEINKNPEDGLESDCIGFSAEGVHDDNAPAFGEPTDFTNSRWPSYSQWSDALENIGLYDVFFCGGHLIGGHPGVRLITPEMVDAVNAAKTSYEKKHEGVQASYDTNEDSDKYYCRLVWLHYWLNWAFNNCETPVIANS